MFGKLSPLVFLALAVLHTPAYAAGVSLSGKLSGTIDDVKTETTTNTVVQHWPEGADFKAKHAPFPFHGNWDFNWNESDPGSVAFTGAVVLGNHFTVTNAGSMGGTTKQNFSDFAYHIKGKADWDAATRTLSYLVEPTDRDSGGASTVSQSQAPTCEKVSGLLAKTGCGAFLSTNTELEGLEMHLSFNEELSKVSGELIMTQYGGSGITKSRTDITTTIVGTLD